MADGDKPTIKDRLYDVPVIGVALRMQGRYVDDDADQYAAAIGFFAFLSLFPLLLLALAIAGFVLRGDPAAQAELADTIIAAIPGFADTFQGDESSVAKAVSGLADNAGTVGLAGLASLLLTGLKVINSASVATLHVFHVDAEVSGLVAKVRQVGVLALLGLLAIAGVAATGLVGAAASLATESASGFTGGSNEADTALQVFATIAGFLGSMGADFLLFLGSYKLLTAGTGPRYREVWPGALVAAIGWTLLKVFGATYVSNQIAKTNELVGAFGGVVGLLLLLYLAGRVYLYGAEFTALIRDPGPDLARRFSHIRWEGEDEFVIGPVFAARKAAAAADLANPVTGVAPVSGEGTSWPSQASIAAPTAPGAPTVAEQPARKRGELRPSPRHDEISPTRSARTERHLQDLDRLRKERIEEGRGGPTGLGGTPGEARGDVEDGRAPDGRADVRGAAAVALAVGAVGALVAAAKPWKDDA